MLTWRKTSNRGSNLWVKNRARSAALNLSNKTQRLSRSKSSKKLRMWKWMRINLKKKRSIRISLIWCKIVYIKLSKSHAWSLKTSQTFLRSGIIMANFSFWLLNSKDQRDLLQMLSILDRTITVWDLLLLKKEYFLILTSFKELSWITEPRLSQDNNKSQQLKLYTTWTQFLEVNKENGSWASCIREKTVIIT